MSVLKIFSKMSYKSECNSLASLTDIYNNLCDLCYLRVVNSFNLICNTVEKQELNTPYCNTVILLLFGVSFLSIVHNDDNSFILFSHSV